MLVPCVVLPNNCASASAVSPNNSAVSPKNSKLLTYNSKLLTYNSKFYYYTFYSDVLCSKYIKENFLLINRIRVTGVI